MELWERAWCGDIDEVKRLVEEEHADVNTKNEHNKTALYYACEKGHTEVAQYLLDRGASVSLGAKPLIAAVTEKHVILVQRLLMHGAHPDALDEGVKYSSRHKLPLHIAAADNSSELVELLLKHGANVDITDYNGHTALHSTITDPLRTTSSSYIVATKNVKSVIDILLENRADVNIVDNYGQTALYVAVCKGMTAVVRKMLQDCGGNPNKSLLVSSPLAAACEEQNVELVDILLKHGADPNVTLLYHEGTNPVCLAAGEICDHCRSRDKLTKNDRDGLTEKLSVVRLLVQHGAHFNVLMPDGQSPLDSVVDTLCSIAQPRGLRYRCVVELLQLMVKHGAVLHPPPRPESNTFVTLRSLATFDGKHEFVVDMLRAGVGFQLIVSCCNAVVMGSWTAKSLCLCQAAVLAGYKPSDEELRLLQSQAARSGVLDQLVNWLNKDRQQVPSLLRQCRVAVRRQLSAAVHYQTILPAIDKLPLPNDMKLYLQFDGVMSEVDLSVSEELQSCDSETDEGFTDSSSEIDYHLLDYLQSEHDCDPVCGLFSVSDSSDSDGESVSDGDSDNEVVNNIDSVSDNDSDNNSEC